MHWFLCKIGFHNWHYFGGWKEDKYSSEIRSCSNCGKEQILVSDDLFSESYWRNVK